MNRLFLLLAAMCMSVSASADCLPLSERVTQAMDGDHRSDSNKARNMYRHPVETLDFFGLEDGMTVMEIWPGGGWYTEILAPAMRNHGKLVIATWDPDVEGQPAYRYELPKKMAATFAASPALYDQVSVQHFSPPESASLGEAESVDMVLTFRNTHGWVSNDQAQDVFKAFARVLKPGGVLGVVQHRASEGSELLATAKQGYVSESAVKELAAQVGLVFEASSEVNANPNDSHDHPKGVWTLAPGFALGDVDKEKYMAIGESDRMTLRFRKAQ